MAGRVLPARGRRKTRSGGGEAGAGAALDAGGDQPVDAEAMAQQLQDAQLFLARLAIGGGHVAGHRVGGLAQLLRQRVLDAFQRLLEPVILGREAGRNP